MHIQYVIISAYPRGLKSLAVISLLISIKISLFPLGPLSLSVAWNVYASWKTDAVLYDTDTCIHYTVAAAVRLMLRWNGETKVTLIKIYLLTQNKCIPKISDIFLIDSSHCPLRIGQKFDA